MGVDDVPGVKRWPPCREVERCCAECIDVGGRCWRLALDLLRRPEISYPDLMKVTGLGPGNSDEKVAEQVDIQVRYAGYLTRQAGEVEKNQRNEDTLIPSEFNYTSVSGLSAELREKLQETLPESIGQASRIPGMTPAAISLLLVYLKRHRGTSQVA